MTRNYLPRHADDTARPDCTCQSGSFKRLMAARGDMLRSVAHSQGCEIMLEQNKRLKIGTGGTRG